MNRRIQDTLRPAMRRLLFLSLCLEIAGSATPPRLTLEVDRSPIYQIKHHRFDSDDPIDSDKSCFLWLETIRVARDTSHRHIDFELPDSKCAKAVYEDELYTSVTCKAHPERLCEVLQVTEEKQQLGGKLVFKVANELGAYPNHPRFSTIPCEMDMPSMTVNRCRDYNAKDLGTAIVDHTRHAHQPTL
jgi:hypothetical protein